MRLLWTVAGSTKGANAPLGFCVRCWVKNERWRPNILCKINSKTPTKVARKYARVEPQTNKFIHYQRWTDTHTYVLKTLWGGLLRRQEKSHIISNDFTRTFLSEVWKEIHVCVFVWFLCKCFHILLSCDIWSIGLFYIACMSSTGQSVRLWMCSFCRREKHIAGQWESHWRACWLWAGTLRGPKRVRRCSSNERAKNSGRSRSPR